MNLSEAEALIWKAHMNVDDPKRAFTDALIEIHEAFQKDYEPRGRYFTDENGAVKGHEALGKHTPGDSVVVYIKVGT